MQFTTIVAVLASAIVVSARPFAMAGDYSSGSSEPSGPPPSSVNNSGNGDNDNTNSGDQCQNNQQLSCCNSPNGDAVAGLQCTLGLIGGTCSGSTQCCTVNSSGQLSLADLCIPIQL